ncbi:hypothetical protein BKA64DRAFT_689981 [Cadophora sp. MPI-SDFR-AT-0126]|nr:hypothetical protein BKA64DRAFT_689981 [Leotiomycetes sp. MPI-SDFR-AT-0126]
MKGDTNVKCRVAVVGSGMAGLVTAYLLNQDPESRYNVEVFEIGGQLSLDSSSLSVPNPTTGITERIDLPMRAFSGGFYNNLRDMYDFLGVTYRPQRFLFGFSSIASKLSCMSQNPPQRLHFVHSSNNHIRFPIRPQTATLISHLFEIGYLIVWYAWFTICCFVVPPLPYESFRSYIRRIRLPRYFVSSYLLPLFSSVATCPHEALLEFPAHDLIDYKKKTNGDQHYTVYGGVNQVQRKLSQGLQIRKSARVVSVEPQAQGIRVCWESMLDNPRSDMSEAIFDKVILAVPPNVVQAIFKPLQYEMSQIPTISVQSVVHADETTIGRLSGTDILHSLSAKTLMKGSDAHIIYLRTFAGDEPQTESIHIQPSGLLVTTCPVAVIDPAKITQCSTFTRVLRTPQSRQIITDVFNRRSSGPQVHGEKSKTQWRNGDNGVWLVGGWCWDGMVLLEGCIVSSMIVADAFGVEIPWKCCP